MAVRSRMAIGCYHSYRIAEMEISDFEHSSLLRAERDISFSLLAKKTNDF
jgi:hypothetical protein